MRFIDELRRRWWLALLGVVLVLLLFGTRLATFITDVLWYDSVGFAHVFWRVLGTRVVLGLVGGLLVAGLVAANLLLARRLAPPYRIPSPQEEAVERYRELLEPFARPLLLTVAVLIGLVSGLSLAGEWSTYLLWTNAVEFGLDDPQFGRDVGFFVFVLPFYQLVNSWLFTALALTVVLTAVAHYLFGGIRPQAAGQKLTPQVNVHLSVLLAGLVAVRAWGFVLDQYLLSYSRRGQVTGLSYTDATAQLIAYQVLAVIAAACVVLFLVNVRFRGWVLPASGVAILLAAAIVLAGIYPAIIQRVQVAPQELSREERYIARNLEFTRYAYGIGDVVYEPFPAAAALEPEEVEANRTTLESIRLWDPATLQNTYAQLQILRPYYTFRDVDVDRYVLDGELRQVMLSAREIHPDGLPDAAQTWQNLSLVYTHGFGLVTSNVSIARADGQPVFFVNNIPPEGVEELTNVNPRIYVGEHPPEYSIVGTRQRELDFPLQGGGQELYDYTGADGVTVGSMFRRLLFALRYTEPNFVLSDLITRDSKVLFRREIRHRIESVAPYLKLDHDPYPVAVDGSIKWILDAYTTTDMIPYSERVDLGAVTPADQRVLVAVTGPDGQVRLEERLRERPGLEGTANYIRNSVKAVVDAYDGTVTLYVVEPDDPVIQAWQRVFPDSFTPGEDASEGLWAHFRYPEDMFRVQAAMFRTYHIQEPDEFYFKEDAWAIPLDAAFARNQEGQGGQERNRAMRPYYLLMRLPGQEQAEFALIQPFTPRERPNLIGWLAGRSDGEHYGQLKAFVMPPDRTVFGPEQIQARVDQEERISAQIGLWNQSGSRVIYGNLLVIPIEDSLLYAQPLFLRAEGREIPELRKVVLIFGDAVVFEDTLEDGLVGLFGAAPEIALPEGVDVGEPLEVAEADDVAPAVGVDGRIGELIGQALEQFARADESLRNGDLAAYQRATREAERLLADAQQLMEGSPPADEPAAPPPPDEDGEQPPDA
jgi:uncharacterized protein